ncbi:MAG: hypothetical protein JWR15_2630 [Prosthecobacter sp.]|nr:hypothetical protein [Prosthecobacter sp.]
MRFGGALHDGEAETGALGFPGTAIRALEHKGQAFAADAHSIIGEVDDAFVTRQAPGGGEAKSAVLIFFEEVFDQVGEDLVPVEAVAAEQAAIEMRQPLITRMWVLRASFTRRMIGSSAGAFSSAPSFQLLR